MATGTHSCEKPAEPGEEAPGPTDCIGAFETESGSVVIYEEDPGTGWIKSDTAVSLAAVR